MAYQLIHKTVLGSNVDGGLEFTGFPEDADFLECRMTVQTDNFTSSSRTFGGLTILLDGGTMITPPSASGPIDATYPFHYQSGWCTAGWTQLSSYTLPHFSNSQIGASSSAGLYQGTTSPTGTPTGAGTGSLGDWTPMIMRIYHWNNTAIPTMVTWWGGAMNTNDSSTYYNYGMHHGFHWCQLLEHPSYANQSQIGTICDKVVMYTDINIGSNPDYGEIKSGSKFSWYGWTDE
jgi:hypothetical protein